MLNTSATTVGSCLLLMLILVLLQLGVAMPWWHRNDAGYDASLDPVAWSRAFVQDQVRKPRISQPMQLPQLEQHRRSWYKLLLRSIGLRFKTKSRQCEGGKNICKHDVSESQTPHKQLKT
ncbi:PREDICTED: uncharacterized protein LOC108614831 [Drosophila arizonae]|uniref:Uncharacterized protein LOC108614831 n=1 Tax=Drosophila arizonae TaxID=7263 RepID=A0ABM1PBF5_DROAR|nr:PREDICTED: uncharacterized protein LOC108614831 [Drosophila arizonae]